MKLLVYEGKVEVKTSSALIGLQKACGILGIKISEFPEFRLDPRDTILSMSASSFPDDSRINFLSSSSDSLSEESGGHNDGQYIHGPFNDDQEVVSGSDDQEVVSGSDTQEVSGSDTQKEVTHYFGMRSEDSVEGSAQQNSISSNGKNFLGHMEYNFTLLSHFRCPQSEV